MSLTRQSIRRAPIKQSSSLTPPPPRVYAAAPSGLTASLVVEGQGVVAVRLSDPKQPFTLTVSTSAAVKPVYAFKLTVTEDTVTFDTLVDGKAEVLSRVTPKEAGLDPDPACQYWFSVDSENRKLRYGKGEIRLETQWAEATIPGPVGQRQPPYLWIFDLSAITYENVAESTVWRDPLAANLPLVVVPSDQITMDQSALYLATVPANLSPECQKLYNNICGQNFRLNTPEFPEFTDAIEASIRDPNGWCYKTLLEKANEFGKPDPDGTYLRITMGVNQGESPGIPYVLEIWPPNHYSPIHNHAGANAVIRVLHGAITVSLYSMLSLDHQTPFATQTFGTDSVTWIVPTLNQTHKLHNTNVNGPTCMTIQCYLYSLENNSHYEYFDYIDNSGTAFGRFDPNSDMDFIPFKALMKQEWTARKLMNLV